MKRESDASETHAAIEGSSDQHVTSHDNIPLAYAPMPTTIAPLPAPGLLFAQENRLTSGTALTAISDPIIQAGTISAINNTTNASAIHSTEPTDSRTPSLQIQTTTTNTNSNSTESGTVSTSPRSSPLTDLNLDVDHDLNLPNQIQQQEPSPSTAAVIGVKEEYPPLRTPRQRKQIDRFSTAIFEPQPQSQSQYPAHISHTSPTAKSSTTPKLTAASPTFAKPASASHRKSSAPSRSGSHSHSRAASLSAASPRRSVGRESVGKEEEVEDDSLRLARELSGAEFGLRRRVGSGSG